MRQDETLLKPQAPERSLQNPAARNGSSQVHPSLCGGSVRCSHEQSNSRTRRLWRETRALHHPRAVPSTHGASPPREEGPRVHQEPLPPPLRRLDLSAPSPCQDSSSYPHNIAISTPKFANHHFLPVILV
ncbi:uncharacterized protein [Periplaneta americana]|uniref:uncharacterized protein isoform X1 n=1 Tax=Periplaneta americana TaxID=6978 RepID=UPI0037E8736E